MDTVGGFYVDLRVALAQVEHHGTGAAGLVHHLSGQVLAEEDKDEDRQDPGEQKTGEGRRLFHDLARKLRAGFVQALHQPRIVHDAGAVDLRGIRLVRKQDHVGADFHLSDLFFLRHGHEGAVVHLLDLLFCQGRQYQSVEHQHQDQHDDIEDQHGSSRLFDFVHIVSFI